MMKIVDKMDKIKYRLLKKILTEMSKGKFGCDVKVPDFEPILKCEIVNIDLLNLYWKTIKVDVLSKGFEEDHRVLEDVPCFGYMDDGDNTQWVTRKRPLTELYINLDWIVKQYKIE